MPPGIRVTVWNEFIHEKVSEAARSIYPEGIHAAIAQLLGQDRTFQVSTATLEDPDHGLTQARLDETDVLFWWGHAAHDAVADAIVDRVQARVLQGMGLVVLHSGHHSKIFRRLMGTSCSLCWREAGERERLWLIEPGHPIARDIPEYIELDHSEMYGEPFAIPTPDELVFVSWYQGGEVFRSGCCWTRGSGRIFYFSPGHEIYPIYHHPAIQQVLINATHWAAPQGRPAEVPKHVPIEAAREKIAHFGATVHGADGGLVGRK